MDRQSPLESLTLQDCHPKKLTVEKATNVMRITAWIILRAYCCSK
jgi:hypothetical protein